MHRAIQAEILGAAVPASRMIRDWFKKTCRPAQTRIKSIFVAAAIHKLLVCAYVFPLVLDVRRQKNGGSSEIFNRFSTSASFHGHLFVLDQEP
jgi:hypothetical protein